MGSGFWELVWGSPSFEFGQPLVNVGALLRLARVVAILRDSHNALIYIAKPEWLACPARFERATWALEGRNVIKYRSPLMADV